MFTIALFNNLLPNMASQLSQLKDFLSYLSTVKGDLSNITAPPFILAPYSAVEIPSHWAAHQPLFLQPTLETDPAQRSLLILQNYLVSLKGVTGHGSDYEARKPVNPFLGELFVGTWEKQKTKIYVEQVSHHPPVTACCIINKEQGISSCGFVRQETCFSPPSGITIKQHGYAVIRDEKNKETHLMTMPTLKIQGLALASPYIELEGNAYVASSSGYVSNIEFESPGKLGIGKKNKVTATLFQVNNPQKAIWKILGQWSDRLTVKDANDDTVRQLSMNDDQLKPTLPTVTSMQKQSSWESRRAWDAVFDGIRANDVHAVNTNKTKIEEDQRLLRKQEKADGVEWQSRLFTKQSDEQVSSLLAMLPKKELKKFDTTKTDGLWMFKGVEHAENVMARLRSQN